MTEQMKPLTPPYISYATFKSTLRNLAKNGALPDRIDNSVLGNMGGSIKLQFLGALRYLGLTNENKHPTQEATALSAASDGEWPKHLEKLLKQHYEEQVKYLAGGTPQQLREAFGNEFPSIVTPAIRFFVSAARDAGMSVAEHHKTVKGRASGNGARKKKKQAETEPNGPAEKPAAGESHAGEEKHAGMMTFPIHLPGRQPGKIVVPDDIDDDEVALIEAQIVYLKLYAKRIKSSKEKP